MLWKLALLGCPTVAAGLYSLTSLSRAQPSAWALVWGMLCMAQELRSTRLPGLGFFSSSLPFWLALAAQPGCGPGLAVLAVVTGLTLRSLRFGSPEPGQRLLETLAEGLPTLAALAAFLAVSLRSNDPWMGPGVAALVVYLVGLLFTQELLHQELPAASRGGYSEARLALLGLAPVQAASALGLAGVSQQQPLAALLLAALCWQLPRLAASLLRGQQELQRGNLMRQMERQQNEQKVLEVASKTLIQVRTLQQTAGEILQLCRQLTQASSLAVFLRHHDQLLPFHWMSPHHARLEQASSAGYSEPVLGQAYHSGHWIGRSEAASPQRLFPDETQVLALPLGGFGVLYLGRAQPAFSPQEIRYLAQAAQQGTLALQIASHMESWQRALEQLQQWTSTLHQLLQVSSQLSQPLDEAGLREALSSAAAALVPHDWLRVQFHGSEPPAQAARGSLLTVPIAHPDLESRGFIQLGSQAPEAFSPLHQNALGLLAGLGGAAWRNLELQKQQREAQAHMAQSSKLASVGQLAAGIAHEINTPLGSVNLNLDMALRALARSPEEVEKRLHKSKQMIAQARDIIEKLLNFSRQDSASATGDGRSAHDLNQLVEETLQLFSQSLQLEGLQVGFHPQPGLPPVLLQAGPIQQVLLNLLLNARDALLAGPRSSDEISILTAQAGEGVVLVVEDRGPGLDEATRQRVFEPFFTTKPVGQGTGLGLTVARQIAEAHQGKLQLHSQPGQGCRVELWLPAAQGKGR